MELKEILEILEGRKIEFAIATGAAIIAIAVFSRWKKVKLREIIVSFTVAAFAVFAIWKGMQVIGSVALILFILVVYRGQTLMVIDIIYGLARNVKQAKYGELEFQLANGTTKTIRVSKHSKLGEGSQILLASLDSSALGLLAEITKNDAFPVKEGYLEPLRLLRNMGLITYDEEKIAASKNVQATQTGKNLIREFGM